MTSKRYVILGDGRKIGLGTYVDAYRGALAAPPDAQFNRSLCDRWPAGRAEVLEQFRAGTAERINRHIPGYGLGRKWCSDWRRAMTQAAHALNTPRLVIYWLPVELKTRFRHRLRTVDFALYSKALALELEHRKRPSQGHDQGGTKPMTIRIRRGQGKRDCWAAVLAKSDWLIATSYSLDTLVKIVVERHSAQTITLNARP